MAAAKSPEGGVRGPSEVTSACAGRDTEGDPNRWCWMDDAIGVRWPSPPAASGGERVDMVEAGCIVGLARAAVSNGFGCSRPSEARGVSWSRREGQSRTMAFGMGKYDERVCVGDDGD